MKINVAKFVVLSMGVVLIGGFVFVTSVLVSRMKDKKGCASEIELPVKKSQVRYTEILEKEIAVGLKNQDVKIFSRCDGSLKKTIKFK